MPDKPPGTTTEFGSDPSPRARKERTENAARRRRQLVEATLRSVVRNGLSATTLATVAEEAGLSQGVAVFYFKTKQALLAEALRHHYKDYRDNWHNRLQAAGDDPAERVAALVRADFAARVCEPQALAVWYAFWGEAKVRPLYADIAEAYDNERWEVLMDAVAQLLRDQGHGQEEAEHVTAGIESLTDGLWLRMHLAPGATTAAEARAIAGHHLAMLFPRRAAQLLDHLLEPESAADAVQPGFQTGPVGVD